MLEEFKKFALRGNVVDLAIGVIIGAAFGKIVDSMVGDIFMPLISSVAGGLDFSNYFLPLSKTVTATSLVDAKKQGAVLAWGNFITIAINFLIIAWVLFLVVKGINRLKTQFCSRRSGTCWRRSPVSGWRGQRLSLSATVIANGPSFDETGRARLLDCPP